MHTGTKLSNTLQVALRNNVVSAQDPTHDTLTIISGIGTSIRSCWPTFNPREFNPFVMARALILDQFLECGLDLVTCFFGSYHRTGNR